MRFPDQAHTRSSLQPMQPLLNCLRTPFPILLSPENQTKLKSILTYDVVPGKITAENFKNMKVRTLQGKPLEIKVNGNDVTVNNAKVNTTPINAANGIIYRTNSVIQP